jgi:hypothetical protein
LHARAKYNKNQLNTQESLRNFSTGKSEEFVAIILVIAGLTRNLQIEESAVDCFAPLAMKQPPSTMLPHCSLLQKQSNIKKLLIHNKQVDLKIHRIFISIEMQALLLSVFRRSSTPTELVWCGWAIISIDYVCPDRQKCGINLTCLLW